MKIVSATNAADSDFRQITFYVERFDSLLWEFFQSHVARSYSFRFQTIYGHFAKQTFPFSLNIQRTKRKETFSFLLSRLQTYTLYAFPTHCRSCHPTPAITVNGFRFTTMIFYPVLSVHFCGTSHKAVASSRT